MINASTRDSTEVFDVALMFPNMTVANKTELVASKRDAFARLAAHHGVMTELVDKSRNAAVPLASLVIHNRGIQHGRTLRWRTYEGRHVRWEVVQTNLIAQPRQVRAWFSDVQDLCELLNLQEQSLRLFIRNIDAGLKVIGKKR